MQKQPFRKSLLAVVLLVVTGAVWFANRAGAQDARTTGYLAFGIVGITSGQTARLNVVTVGVNHDVPVELTFLDDRGNVVARIVERLQPGRATGLDFPLSRILAASAIRYAGWFGGERSSAPRDMSSPRSRLLTT